MKVPIIFLVVLCWTLDNVIGQDCESKDTCDQCIQELHCFWCTTLENDAKSHCMPATNRALCSARNTEDPQQYSEILEQKSLTESEQISPQKIKLKLRKNEKFEIKFRYKQSDNYPVDLYYLMDVSNSMNSSKRQLADLGKDLAAEMRRKTNNFKIGFGSFVDKLTLPYVNTHPDALKKPCEGCVAPYSFKNHLSLQSNASLFSISVKNTKLSGNLDTPEGGLDAIMQSIVCQKEIGWRKNARHLLVMSTDAVSHIAGDGKLGGVIEPNDAKCHMTDNTYTHGLVYDYPSVSHINYVARENNINLIFAIVAKLNDPEYLTDHYKGMSNMIENSKTGTLNDNSNNVVKFISDIYDQIRASVKITSDAGATKDVSVNIMSTCPNFANGGCSNVELGETLNFTAIIEPLMCHRDAESNKKTITIKPEGLQDSLVIELEVLCDCDCAAHKKVADPSCNGAGAQECGICRCDKGRFGAKCQCDRKESKTTDTSGCIKPGLKNLTCSSNGKCICGKCACNKDFYGKYCECSSNCGESNCSGHGFCNCGKCECDKDWSGDTCDCSASESQCFAPNSDNKCSGNGNCTCNACACNVNNSDKTRYTLPYCEKYTPQKSCEDLKPCVECTVHKTGIYANNSVCMENCNNYTMTKVNELQEEPADGMTRCRVAIDGMNCDIRFEFLEINNYNYAINAAEKKICWNPISPFVWISGVIGLVLLIGIFTLIGWKVITTYHDKNEYAKFVSERSQQTTFGGENPLYKPGTSHFQNIAYLRASQRFSVLMQNDKLGKDASTSSKPDES